MNYDLKERTAKFGEETIKFVQAIPINDINRSLINQLVRSATSVGANYMEANQASSSKDFKNKIKLAKRKLMKQNIG